MLVAIVAAGCGGDGEAAATLQTSTGLSRVVFTGGGETRGALEVEVARSGQEKARGLMERRELGSDRGMIFIWDKPTRGSFWMKNTYIPLSIAFVSADGVIVDIQDMQPLSQQQHVPAKPYVWAIEVNQGWYAGHGIQVGDRVEYSEN